MSVVHSPQSTVHSHISPALRWTVDSRPWTALRQVIAHAILLAVMRHPIRYGALPTERRHPRSRDLDRLSLSDLLRLINREDARVIRAVASQLPQVARAVRLIAQALRRGGRLFFIGAGTSGRLGVIEAAECPPTFSTSSTEVQAIIAGGRRAVFRSQEGAEDNRASARQAARQRIRRGDVVVGVAASGVTPFVDETLREAARRGARTVLVSGDPHAAIPAGIRITPVVGPEVLTGSTRLKMGTATKLVLNMLTLGAMVQLGKTYGNLMVDVRPSSRKLLARAVSLIQSITGCSEQAAQSVLRAARGRVKLAILMQARRLSSFNAARRLAAVDGSLRRALEDHSRLKHRAR